ncbi:MAG TPA: hypothetical protein VLS48_00760 [Anaerolineales bacterium]|nr:hypothetical protein [Anaerolineales bacterium]
MDLIQSPLVWVLGIFMILLLLVIIVWRVRGEQEVVQPPPPTAKPTSADDVFPVQQLADRPGFEDIALDMTREGGFSTQLQTARSNLRIEGVRDRQRFVINGATYPDLASIPDPELKALAQRLYDKAFSPGPLSGAPGEELRQVWVGSQSTIESRSPNHTISVQSDGKATRYIINGLTHQKLNDITDPNLRRMTQELQKRMV